MDQTQIPIWIYVIASAATGAIVSSSLRLIGQWRERKWRRKEVLLKQSSLLAVEHVNKMLKVAEVSGQKVTIKPHMYHTANFYKWLDHLIDKNELPEEAKPKSDRELGL